MATLISNLCQALIYVDDMLTRFGIHNCVERRKNNEVGEEENKKTRNKGTALKKKLSSWDVDTFTKTQNYTHRRRQNGGEEMERSHQKNN